MLTPFSALTSCPRSLSALERQYSGFLFSSVGSSPLDGSGGVIVVQDLPSNGCVSIAGKSKVFVLMGNCGAVTVASLYDASVDLTGVINWFVSMDLIFIYLCWYLLLSST